MLQSLKAMDSYLKWSLAELNSSCSFAQEMCLIRPLIDINILIPILIGTCSSYYAFNKPSLLLEIIHSFPPFKDKVMTVETEIF